MSVGKKTRNKKYHDEFGDAVVNVPQQVHNIKYKYTLQRLILALRAAWGTAVRMEPTNHLGHSYNKQPATWMRTTLAHTAAMTMLLRLFLMTDRDWSPPGRANALWFSVQCARQSCARLKFFCAKERTRVKFFWGARRGVSSRTGDLESRARWSVPRSFFTLVLRPRIRSN